jgi:hypothetical protein
MIERLKGSRAVNEAPLTSEPDIEVQTDIEKGYAQLGLWQKIMIFLQVVFKQAERERLVESMLLEQLAGEIERGYPGLISPRENRLLPYVYDEIRKLSRSLEIFKESLNKALTRERKEFIAFLAGAEMPEIQERILREADPVQVAEDRGYDEETDIKRELEFRLDDIWLSIDDSGRQSMYNHIRTLQLFERLVFFPYNRVLKSFESGERIASCALKDVEKPLGQLAEILYSLRTPPRSHVVQILYRYHTEEGKPQAVSSPRRVIEPDTGSDMPDGSRSHDAERKEKKFLEAADKAITTIRRFNRAVPLVTILKLATENLEYAPAEISGGEDWLPLYKEYWNGRVDRFFASFAVARKRTRILENAKAVLGIYSLPTMAYYRSAVWGEGVRVRYESSVPFLQGIMNEVFFDRMNTPLKSILLDGQFYKEQNREEFNDAYTGIMQIPDMIGALENSLSGGGHIGREIEKVKKEMIAPKIRAMKIRTILKEADSHAEKIVRQGISCLGSLTKILQGILYGEVGGQYDTLANLGRLGSRNHKAFLIRLEETYMRAEAGYRALDSLLELEFREVEG